MMTIQKLSPIEWEKNLKLADGRTLFHHYDWAQFIAKQYRANFIPFLVESDESRWLVPCYQDLPWARGIMATSSIGHGGPLSLSPVLDARNEITVLQDVLSFTAKSLGDEKVDALLYPSGLWESLLPTPDVAITHTIRLHLNDDIDRTFNTVISGNARTAIRKSRKSGIIVKELDYENPDSVTQSLSLLNDTQQRVGSTYLTDRAFYEALCNLDSKQVHTKIFVAYFHDTIVGMALCVFDKNELFHLFHGWDRQYASLCANQSLIWHMIEFATKNKIRIINMGSSHSSELTEAKLRWGGNIEVVPRIHLQL